MSQDGRAPDPATRTEGEGETLDMPEGRQPFTSGQVLGERYQILEMLGRGGMGDVWHAFDLKLRVEVALKALREDFFKSERRLELLRQEVRAAREVMSPNVCRIFDLIEIEGRELVSMEYVDGATLLGVLQERGPLELKEAQDIASQFLAGLEAIHKVGLIHRDIKPENIMLTRAGRVVVMDFGLARQEVEGGGSVSGTPAYMAPEQVAGQTLDPRADVYSAGVVLAEMVSPEGIKNFESRQSVWEGLRSEPAKVPDSPWAPVLKKAVAKDREGRFNTAHTLTRALEDVTLRVEGADDLHPYPGLASFTEDNAEYFFGREAEVEQLWRKLEGPARMLAMVGPSGAGKTSFLQAGLFPTATAQWATTICKPGNNPQLALGRALAPEMAGDVDVMDLLLRFDDPDVAVDVLSRWRRRNDRALLVVDQFEELFTQNSDDEQQRFADLLNRLVLDADVFVLLSMRDDFLMRCRDFEALKPTFSDMTAMPTLAGQDLRRALVRPATKCGYRFEDDELVEEMLAEVEGERGALPLLAFAAAQLWEQRDRETGHLTRQAYHDIGGVGGALARHAEATIDRIGTERIAHVREIFRNLVTAEGTRAVREWEELLSVFDTADVGRAGINPAPTKERATAREGITPSPTNEGTTPRAGKTPAPEAADEVLRELIDARLLTSYEVREEDEEPTRRVEIIHESLLANWPRLVRWQTQDADAAQLRDQLRQAARTWDDQGRSDDTLWTGSAYREFAVWREGYPGGLTEIEEAFAAAMTSLATRRRRRRRVATVAALILAIAVASVFGVLWRRSMLETRRAEAAKLLALAENRIDTDPTEALAFATASLGLIDTEAARIFAVRALWAGPPAMALDLYQANPDGTFPIPSFSPNGRWLATAGLVSEQVLVWNESGGPPIVLGGHAVSASGPIQCGWTSDGHLITGHQTEERVRIWTMPQGRLVREIELGGNGYWQVGHEHLFAKLEAADNRLRLRSWRMPEGDLVELGEVDMPGVFDPGGRRWVYAKGHDVFSLPLPVQAGVPDTLIARHSGNASVGSWRRPDGFYSSDSKGEIILWTSADGTSAPGRRLPKIETAQTFLFPSRGGIWAVERDHKRREGRVLLWNSQGTAGARPAELRRSGDWYMSFVDFHPRDEWVVASTRRNSEASFWPLSAGFQTVVENYDSFPLRAVEFTPDSHHLITNWGQDRVRLWPLPGGGSAGITDLMLPGAGSRMELAIDPSSENVLAGGFGDGIFLLSLGGAAPREFRGFPASDLVQNWRRALGSHFMTAPGGKGANQALAAARAGAKVRLIGATGADPYADQALALLKAGGVDLSGIHRVDAATGTAFVIVGPAGENQIAVMSGANLALTPAIVGELVFKPGDVLLMQLEIPVTTMAPTLSGASQAGALTLLNLAPFNAAGLPLARQADVVIVNEVECAALGERARDQLCVAARHGRRHSGSTGKQAGPDDWRGRRDCLYTVEHNRRQRPACECD